MWEATNIKNRCGSRDLIRYKVMEGNKMSEIKKYLENTKERVVKNLKDVVELKQLKAKIAENEKQIQKIYKDMGIQYFEQHTTHSSSELQDLVKEIASNIEREKELNLQKNELYGKKECFFCRTVNEKGAKYCIKCGNPLDD